MILEAMKMMGVIEEKCKKEKKKEEREREDQHE